MKKIREEDVKELDIKKVLEENAEEYNLNVREFKALKERKLAFTYGENHSVIDEQKENYIGSLTHFEDLIERIKKVQESVAETHDYMDSIKAFCVEFNQILEKVSNLYKEAHYKQIIDLLDTVDLNIFANPYHVDYLYNAEQTYYWTRAKAYQMYLATSQDDYDAIIDYITTSKKLRVHTSYRAEKISAKDKRLSEGENTSIYIEDSYRYFMMYNQRKMNELDIKSFDEFNFYFDLYSTIKEDSKSFTKLGRDAFLDYEAIFMNWFNSLAHIAFFELKDLDISLDMYHRIEKVNRNLVKDEFYRESNNEKEFRRYFEENILATCSKDEMRAILRQAASKDDVSGLVNILCTPKVQVAYYKEIVNELNRCIDIYARWELLIQLIEKYKEVAHRKILEELLKNVLKRKYISWSLPVICHYLYVSYHYSEDHRSLLKIEAYSKRIFSSPRVHRCRHKLEGFEIIQVYRLSTNKPFNKKDSMYYFGSSSYVVTGEERFIPKPNGFILLSKILIYILMALCVAGSAFILLRTNSAGVKGYYNPVAYEISGVLLASIAALQTFKVVYYSSDDEIGAIVSRYIIIGISVLMTIVYTYLQAIRIFDIPNFIEGWKPNIINRFLINAYNISIVVAVVGAILNLSSFFYINKKEKKGVTIFMSILTSLIAIYLIALMAYTIFTWTPPVIESGLRIFRTLL